MSNNPPSEEQISALAHHFWEEEGRPEGQAEEHWARAQEQLCGGSAATEAVPEAAI